jgi:hypothetical protein
LLGLGLVQVAAARASRLPNRPGVRGKALAAAAFMVAGIISGGAFYLSHRQDRVTREALVACLDAYRDAPSMTLVEQSIDYRQEGDRMRLSSRLVLENRTGGRIDEILLYLNPGLRVVAARDDGGKALGHVRDRLVVRVAASAGAGERSVIELDVEGRIDERACLLDVTDDARRDASASSAFNCRFGRRHALLDRSFTWLTPDCSWYPVTAAPANPANPYNLSRDFSRYTLRVVRPAGRTVLSQGAREESGDTVVFRPEQPLKGITLCIGDFSRHSITVDSTVLELYLLRGHDYLTRGLEQLADTLPERLQGMKTKIEATAGRDYPFRRFALVEAPLPIASHYREWHGGSDLVHPEIVLFPERGLGVCPDFERERSRGHVKYLVSVALESLLLKQELKIPERADFARGIARHALSRGPAVRPEKNPREIMSLFHDHAGALRSPDFPLLDATLHVLLRSQYANSTRIFSRGFTSPEHLASTRVNAYLDGHSLQEAVEDRTLDPVLLAEILDAKAGELSRLFVPRGIDGDTLLAFVKRYAGEHPFREIPFEQFNRDFSARFGADWRDVLPAWYAGRALPAYLVEAPVVWPDEEGGYRVSFAVFNDSDTDGVVTLQGVGQRNLFSGTSSVTVLKEGASTRIIVEGFIENIARDVPVPARTGKRVVLRVGDKIMFPSLGMHVARNTPNFLAGTEQANGPSGVPVGEMPVGREYFFTPGEVVVDDSDPGFSVVHARRGDGTRAWLQRVNGKPGVPVVATGKWNTFLDARSRGLFILGEHRKLAGSGRHPVRWTARVEEEGMHEVSAYLAPRMNLSVGVGTSPDEATEAFQHYAVSTAGGVEEVSVNIIPCGWISLGRFRLPAGECSVTLDDRGEKGQVIIADAVKWVRVE